MTRESDIHASVSLDLKQAPQTQNTALTLMSVPSEPALKFVEIQLDPTPVDALKDSF
jgi:hypothetical protein